MTQEQARQEAEIVVKKFDTIYHYKLSRNRLLPVSKHNEVMVKDALISINREIELLEELIIKLKHYGFIQSYFKSKLQGLNQIKDELLKM
jgi:hypothetical protein